jgi:hypothetical protein
VREKALTIRFMRLHDLRLDLCRTTEPSSHTPLDHLNYPTPKEGTHDGAPWCDSSFREVFH